MSDLTHVQIVMQTFPKDWCTSHHMMNPENYQMS